MPKKINKYEKKYLYQNFVIIQNFDINITVIYCIRCHRQNILKCQNLL